MSRGSSLPLQSSRRLERKLSRALRLLDDDYERIKSAVADLYRRYSVATIPVDVFSLARKMGIAIRTYSSYPDLFRLALRGGAPEDGFKANILDGTRSTTVIFYNDTMSRQRIRFTILHEIGHIVLGHKQSSELAEAEANFFAKYAIAPPVLVRCIHPTDYVEIADAFDISLECAYFCMGYYAKWLRFSYGDYDYETTIEELFTFVKGGDRILRMKKGA